MLTASALRLQRQPWLIAKRLAHEIRVRFAPSPTGNLHLGGLRTALYNYLYARAHKGKFLLRIEDTDQTRLMAGAMERLIEDLLWAGIEIDEGPGPEFKGSKGPYIQSERIPLYQEEVSKLLDNGSAYRCFCTERRLELLRHEAIRTRQVPRYDNKCRHLNSQQIAENLDKATPHCVRFKLTNIEEPFHDLIYGSVQHNVWNNEGDPVIVKSDGFPTYHFANVVDDHHMAVTHVLRGVEWQISTPKHLLLYKAFGWQPPQYGHLPLLVNADGSKLSKRQGDIGIRSFRERGFFPEAIINYVISAGGGFNRAQTERSQVYSLQELTQQFSIDTVNSHPSRLNPELLGEFNRQAIRRRLESPKETVKLVETVRESVQQTLPQNDSLQLDAAHVERILRWSVTRISFLHELTTDKLSFLWVKPRNNSLTGISPEQLQRLIERLENSSQFNKDSLNAALKGYAKEENIKFPALMKQLRSLLSGLKEGPGVAEMMEILGRDAVLQCLRKAHTEPTADSSKQAEGSSRA